MSYIINQTSDEYDNTVAVITVYLENGNQIVAQDSHPNYKAIVIAAIDGYLDEVEALYDVPSTISRAFNRVTERITVSGESLFVDGDPMDDSLANQILRFMDDGLDFQPLVNFLDKLTQNPNEHSRKMTYDWLRAHDFTITDSGDIIGYKGVSNGHSTTPGKATVNGEVIKGKIPYPDGAIVEMPRSEVAHNPSESCSTGLHVATFGYASGYGNVLEVHVNPRDIVSVPTDAGGEKVRVCRLTVIGPISEPYGNPLKSVEPVEEPLVVQPTEEESVVLDINHHHPTPDAFTVMQQRAKRRRRNFVKYATKHGPWTLNGDDADNRMHWEVTA